MKGYIYKLTNITNGKIYIGKTLDIKRRRFQHSTITPKYNHHLGNAIKKYGIDSFNEEIILKIQSNNINRLNIILSSLEKFYIKKYNSYHYGYNSTLGGEGTSGFKWSAYSRNRLSASQKEYFKTSKGKEHIQHCIIANKNRTISEYTRKKIGDGNKGKVQSLEAKDKIRKYQYSIAYTRYKPIVQLDLYNNIIKEYNSITEASLFLSNDVKYTSHITSCCKGTRKTAYGFIWKYKEEYYGK